MKKVFISQPMKGKSVEEIKTSRMLALVCAKTILGEDVDDAYPFVESNISRTPLYMLGDSIRHMSTADVVYFMNGWENYVGCRIEHECALNYGMYIIKE